MIGSKPLTPSKGNRSILMFTLVVIMLGFGMIIPILPYYVESFGAKGSALGALMATYGLMQFIFAPIWGQLSDRYGRKKILLLGVLGNALTQLLFGLSTELWMLFASRLLSGMLSSATLPTAMAYISDTTSKEQRSGGMGALGAAMGMGMVLGPFMGGALADYSLTLPFFVGAGLSMLAWLAILLFLPESLSAENREQSTTRVNGPRLNHLFQALAGPLGFLFLMAFMLSFALANFEAIFGLYAYKSYGYEARTVGWLFAVLGLTSAAVQGGLTGPLTRRWGESNVIRVSLVGSALGFILLTRAWNMITVLLAICFFIGMNALLNPAVASLISKRASGGQGAVMGLNNSFLSLGRVVGPLWAGFMFDINKNFPYFSGATILVIGFGLSLLLLRGEPVPLEETFETL